MENKTMGPTKEQWIFLVQHSDNPKLVEDVGDVYDLSVRLEEILNEKGLGTDTVYTLTANLLFPGIWNGIELFTSEQIQAGIDFLFNDEKEQTIEDSKKNG